MKHNNLPGLSWIFGEETFLVETHVKKIKEACEESINISGPDLLEIWQAQSQALSLFTTNRVLLVFNPWFLDKAPTDPQNKVILSVLEQAKVSTEPTVIISTEKVDQRKKWATWLKKNVPVTAYPEFKDWEQQKIIQWIQSWGEAQGKTITQGAAVALEQLGGTNLRYLSSEIEKVCVFVGSKASVTEHDIFESSAGASGRIFQFTESLKSKNLSQGLQSLTRLLETNEDPIKLIGLLSATLRFYIQILDGLKQKQSLADLATQLGKNPFFLKQVAPIVQKKYTLDQLKKAHIKLAELDVLIKSGKMAANKAIEIAVLNVLF